MTDCMRSQKRVPQQSCRAHEVVRSRENSTRALSHVFIVPRVENQHVRLQDDINYTLLEMFLRLENFLISITVAGWLLSIRPAILGKDTFSLPPSFDFDDAAEGDEEYDLLAAVKIPFQDVKTQYVDEDGHDGFPAFGFRAGSDVKIAPRQILPEKLPSEFSILVRAKPRSRRGGYIFAVVNPYDTVVQLGVKLSPDPEHTNISLIYTDSSQIASQVIANFSVNRFLGKWTRFAFRVSVENVTLFFNCVETDTVVVQRSPLELVFDSASTLYIAQAGPRIQEPYEGALDQLKIYDDPEMAAAQCKTDFQGFESDSDNAINNEIDRNDFDGQLLREGSGSDDLSFLPPPPPPPDGKICKCGQPNCCNYLFDNNLQDDSRIRALKGERGLRGPPGESIRGPPGPPGPPGIPGTLPEGSCSCNFTSMLSTLAAPNLLPGPPGPPGTEGKQGPPGITGQAGPPGERGAAGPQGDKGERGEAGPVGPEGLQGPKGEAGRDGLPGQQGPPGPPGPPGPVEFENVDEGVIGATAVARSGMGGPKGEPGTLGPPGPRGERGLQGSKGARGETGAKGDRGDRGFPGERGSQGPKGEPGSPGLDGIPGTPGANGKNAEKGEKGEPGKPGPPGLSSVPLNFEETMGYGPGQPGLKGEHGDKGEKGDRGDHGADGLPGLNGAIGSPGEKGESGLIGPIGPMGPPGSKGERGERGPPGPISVVDSDTHILTVKGDKGEIGKRGRRGKPGPQGPMGPPGKPGSAGEIGVPGWMGRPGPPGLQGLPGTKGEKGEVVSINSIKGDKGDRGQDGIPGKDGAPGNSGDNVKYVPVPGPPGPPGPPGTPGLSITGPKGEPGSSIYGEPTFNLRPGRATASPPIFTIQEPEIHPKVVPGAITYQDRNSMTKMTTTTPVGTLAYIIEEEALLVRVNQGWQYVALGSLLTVTTPTPPTHPPQLHPPFETGNLINTMSKPPDINWQPKMLRIAALNKPYSGDVRGVRGADYACYRESRRGGLRGTFRALLSSRSQNIDSIVRQVDRQLPVSNLRGEVLFNSWSKMFDGTGAPFSTTPRIFSFDGRNVNADSSWPIKAIWHGAMINGERNTDSSCDDWHFHNKGKMGLASSLKSGKLLEQETYPCNKHLIVLCIEVTSEIYTQRRRRDLTSVEDLMSEEEYQEFLLTIE